MNWVFHYENKLSKIVLISWQGDYKLMEQYILWMSIIIEGTTEKAYKFYKFFYNVKKEKLLKRVVLYINLIALLFSL